jgi:hypothetical protein
LPFFLNLFFVGKVRLFKKRNRIHLIDTTYIEGGGIFCYMYM